MNTEKKIAYNSLASIALRFFYTAASLVLVGLMTRYLGRQGYGDYATILAFVYIFVVLADLGLYSLTIREISKEGSAEEKIVKNAFTIRFFAGFFLFIICAASVWFFPYSTIIKKGVGLAAIGFWFLSNVNVLLGVFQKYLRVDKVGLAEFLSRMFQLGIVFFLIKSQASFLTLILAISAGGLLNFVLIWFFISKYIKLAFDFDFTFWKKLLKQSLPLGLAAVFVMIYFKLDTVMLSLMKDSAEVGIYSVAYKVLENFVFLPTMFVGLVMPLFSKYYIKEKSIFKKIIDKTHQILFVLIWPIVFGGILLSSSIILILAGPDFLSAGSVLAVLMIALGFIFLGALYSNILIATGWQKKLTLVYGLGAIINLVLNFVFIPRFASLGAAGTTLFTEIFVTVLMLYFVFKAVGFLPKFKSSIAPLLAALLMGFVIYFFKEQNLFLLVVGGALFYGLFLIAFGGISKSDIAILIKKDERAF